MTWTIVAPIVIVGGALVIIGLERRWPYDRGQRFLRDGFWVDLVGYALVQNYMLALVIHGLVSWVDAQAGASTHGLVSDWPIAVQVAFFVVTHDLYTYGSTACSTATAGCGGSTRRTTRRRTSTGSRDSARTPSRSSSTSRSSSARWSSSAPTPT